MVFYTTEWAYNHDQNFLLDFYKTNPNYLDDYNDYIVKLLSVKIDMVVLHMLPINYHRTSLIKTIYDEKRDEIIKTFDANKINDRNYQLEYDESHIVKAYATNYNNLPRLCTPSLYLGTVYTNHIMYGIKLPNLNYDFNTAKLFNHAFRYDRISSLEYLFSANRDHIVTPKRYYYYCVYIVNNGIDIACKHNYVSVLEWIKCNMLSDASCLNEQTTNITSRLDLIIERIINLACKYGHIDILDWCYRWKFSHNSNAIDDACEYGHVSVLDWFAEHPDLKFAYTEAAINKATLNGHTSILNWFKSHDMVFKYKLNIIKNACRNKKNSRIRKWYKKNMVRISNGTKLYKIPLS